VARKIVFSKYHGLENDFLVIERARLRLPLAGIPNLVHSACSRHTGIGADGVVLFSLRDGDIIMQLFNADGSEAEVSGNGLRILAQHLRRSGIIKKRRFAIESKAGRSLVRLVKAAGDLQQTEIELARPSFITRDIPMKVTNPHFIQQPFETEAGSLIGTVVSVGNPHIVFFVDHFDFDWQSFGAAVAVDRRFPRGVNVEFAMKKSRHQTKHCSWERGVGPTRACATGAAAVVAAGIMGGVFDHEVLVNELAGDLLIRLSSLDEPIHLTGPSVFVAEGVLRYDANE
jgi:diaminopimelate epimerase